MNGLIFLLYHLKKTTKSIPLIQSLHRSFFYMIPRPFANALPTANIDGIDQGPKPYFSSARNHISPAALIAIT
jgi:hypothetical protein